MAFEVKDWRDFPNTTTPITAAALEDLEARLATYSEESITTAMSDAGIGAAAPANATPYLYGAERAASFIESMLEPIERPLGASTIRPNQDYPPTYLGPIAGTFALRDGTPAVSGGNFTGYSVESHVVTDVDYLIETKPAKADGTWSFDFAQPGEKRFVLRRDSDDAMLAEFAQPFTNVRSYIVAEGQPGFGTDFVLQSYMYDQAVALCAALALGRTKLAQRLAVGMTNYQTKGGVDDGGLIFSARQIAPTLGDKAYRTGAHAIGTYALLSYVAAFPDDRTRDFGDAADRAVTWLQAQIGSRDLVTGGKGVYTDDGFGNQTFDPDTPLTWASAEHNFDAYHAFKLADAVRGGYATVADTIGEAVQTTLWDSTRNRFLQGVKDDGTPDTADPLDCHSWGAIFCMSLGATNRARDIMTAGALAPYANTRPTPEGIMAKGYAVNYDEPGYPGALPTVWSEGTFGVAYAFSRMNDPGNWRATMDGIVPSQAADGSYFYVTDADDPQDLFPYRSTIGAAWSILAMLGHGIWGYPGNR
jgi:hypothetical protein